MNFLKPGDYTLAWCAPLEIEAKVMLERRHSAEFAVGRGADYVSQAGSIGQHNVVIAILPAGQGYETGSAATLAGQAKKSFPNLEFGFFVVVAAGLPQHFGAFFSLEII